MVAPTLQAEPLAGLEDSLPLEEEAEAHVGLRQAHPAQVALEKTGLQSLQPIFKHEIRYC